MAIYVNDSNGNKRLIAGRTTGNVQSFNGRTGTVLPKTGDYSIDMVGGSNPNLLLNWYFRNPVNRNGMIEYAAANFCIDRWYLYKGICTVGNGCITLTPTSSNAFQFYQDVKRDVVRAKTVTFSVLSATYGLVSTVCQIPESGTFDTANVETADFYIDALATSNDVVYFRIIGKTHDTPVDIIAVKLELGSHQTLARQNDAGEWEIIDPPDYDLQYALCSLYSPITGEWVGSQHSNPNLLDNWYFANPINQRGQTEYTGGGYTIDRWAGYVGIPSVTLTSDGVQLTSGDWGQPMELAKLIPTVYTCSVLLTGNKFISFIMDVTDDNEKHKEVTDKDTGFSLIFYYRWSNGRHLFFMNSNGATNKVIAAKLELGPVQTLAHKEGDTWVLNDPPPNKALELAKCQRYLCPLPSLGYYNGFVNAGKNIIHIPYHFINMRSNPTVINAESYANDFYIDCNGIRKRLVYGTDILAISFSYKRIEIKISNSGGTFNDMGSSACAIWRATEYKGAFLSCEP